MIMEQLYIILKYVKNTTVEVGEPNIDLNLLPLREHISHENLEGNCAL